MAQTLELACAIGTKRVLRQSKFSRLAAYGPGGACISVGRKRSTATSVNSKVVARTGIK